MTLTYRVLRLITRLNIGGPARQALLLTRELAADYPTLLAAGKPPAVEGELTDPRVSVRNVPLVRPVRPVADARALRAVTQLLEETRPELVHTHMAKAGGIGRWAGARARSRPRLVHTYHGHVLDSYFRSPAVRVFIEIERRLARRTDVLVAVSEEVRDSLLALGIGEEHQYRVIPLGFDLSSFLAVSGRDGNFRARLGLDDEVPLVGVMGRLAPIKDHATLLRAISRVPDVHLAVLGDGELRPELERNAQDLGIANRVHFVGWWSDVAAAVADMDLVALTSRNEGTPVSLIEASAAARPVVATDVGGVGSVVHEGETGFLIDVGDEVMLADRIRKLLEDPELGARLGTRGRSHVARLFSLPRLVDDIRSLYAELIGERDTVS